MLLLENLEDSLRTKSLDLLATHGREERIAWFNHPVTTGMLLQLRADFLKGLNDFSSGAFVSDTVEKTAMEACALMVKVQSLEQIIQSIEEIKESDGDEDNENGSSS